jgi:hypothetical protein
MINGSIKTLNMNYYIGFSSPILFYFLALLLTKKRTYWLRCIAIFSVSWVLAVVAGNSVATETYSATAAFFCFMMFLELIRLAFKRLRHGKDFRRNDITI